ncbi:MAG: nucleotidyl transferase AbiEii/AbiGii toxin family protein [Lachnospiraceae bacterium]|nr:nucleotidyl transferase AbiEii/AbiGii toxin family protein [Lachnospiraceae bacterium]
MIELENIINDLLDEGYDEELAPAKLCQGVTMIINSKEQIFSEKLYSLLKHATFSTRYKDIFDMHYLSKYVEKNKLIICLDKYIFKDDERENSVDEIVRRLENIFRNKRYLTRLHSSRKNWEEIEISVVLNELLIFLNDLK